MNKIEETKILQTKFDERQVVIKKATDLISQCKFKDAIDLLNTID